MKIIKRNAYKIDKIDTIAENIKEIDACLICHLLNKDKEGDYTYFYQVVPDDFILKE